MDITSFMRTAIGSKVGKAILFERNSPQRALPRHERFRPMTAVMFCLLAVSMGKATAEQLQPDHERHFKITTAVSQFMNEKAAEIRKTIPKRVDLITKLVDVRVDGDTFIYGMEVQITLSDAELQVVRRKAQIAITRAACQDDEIRYMVRSGASVSWIYTRKGLILVRVTVSSCPS